MRHSETPPAIMAVTSPSAESRCMASSVPSNIAIGITSSKNCGMSHRKYSIATQSEACCSVTKRPMARICVATKISVKAETPNTNGPRQLGNQVPVHDRQAIELPQPHLPRAPAWSMLRSPGRSAFTTETLRRDRSLPRERRGQHVLGRAGDFDACPR